MRSFSISVYCDHFVSSFLKAVCVYCAEVNCYTKTLSGRACGRRKKIVVLPSVGIGVLEGRKSARHHRLLFGVVHASATRRFALLCFGSTFVWAVYPTLVAESATDFVPVRDLCVFERLGVLTNFVFAIDLCVYHQICSEGCLDGTKM